MIDQYDDIARESGARVVSFCGHDCIPWDLIVLECATALKKKGEQLAEVKIYDEIVAGPSGGTLETVFHSLENRFVDVRLFPLLSPQSSSENFTRF